MKKLMKTMLIMAVTLCCVLASVSNGSIVVSAATSGKIGNQVSFSFRSSTKTLTVKGKGEIDVDMIFNAPWEDYAEDIETLIVEEGVSVIPDYTFMCLKNLKKVKLADSVTSLGWYSFESCVSLKSIQLPKSLKTLVRGAFNGCTNLKEISISKENDYFTTKDGVLFTKDMKTLMFYPPAKSGSSYTIPNGVIQVEDYAFAENQNIKTLKSSDSVAAFNDCACHEMKKLETVIFSENLNYLYADAFAYCYELKNVELPEGVVSVGDSCFYACRSLKNLIVLGKDTNVGYFKSSYPSFTMIEGYSGSKAQAYAKRTGKKFKNIESGKITNYQKDNQTFMKQLPTSGLEANEPSYHGIHSRSYQGVFNGYHPIILHESDTNYQYYKEIKQKVKELCSGLTSKKEKAKAITKFVYRYLDYDMGHLANSMTSVYRAWVNKRGSCESFAMLTNYMLYLAGIPTATVTSSAHEWSAALIDGKWITIDSTSGRFDMNPNDQDSINAISFTDNNGTYVIDGYDGVILAGIGYGYNDSRKTIKSYTVPKFVDVVHDSVFDCTNDDFVLKGKRKESVEQSLIQQYVCVKKDSNYFYARDKHDKTYEKTIKATATKDGKREYICQGCNNAASSSKIVKVSKISLSSTSFTYDGKSKKPSVIVKDDNGLVIHPFNYTVTYSSGRTNVGRYSATITFKGGKYKGSVTKTFLIRPKSTTIKSFTANKTKIKVNLNRRKTQTSGYEIQYATNKNFTNAKTVVIKDNLKLSTTISSLKSGTRYYIRVRTYKNIKYSGKSMKVYSTYSSAKSIKTK